MIRRGRPEDAERLAWVHIRAWQQAYAGLLPDDFLAGLMDALPRRAELWRGWLEAQAPWVAETPAGEVIGFVSSGDGEVFAIYVLAEHWGTGVGRDLMVAALDSLREAGHSEATLWVLDTNERARRFYERGGWQVDGATRTEEMSGVQLPEVRYRIKLQGAT